MADPSSAFLRSSRRHWTLRYGGALLATLIALFVWYAWPVVRNDPFVGFVAAVIVTARFFGFGPALLCTAASSFALDYFALPPRGFLLSMDGLERLTVFVVISVLTAGLARKRSQAEISADETRQKMAAIVASSEDAIFSTTRDGMITSWNRGAESLYGYSAAEAIGRDISMLAPPERATEIPHNAARLNRGEHVGSYETERMRKDGTRMSVSLSISPLRNSKGDIVGSSAIARDISAQKRAGEALRRNEKLATAGRLAAAIAHEINNPLEAVTNLLYLARHDPSRQNEYLAQAEKEVQRIAEFAQQTLGFVREPSAASPLDVAQTLEQVLHLYAGRLMAKHIRLDKQYQPDVTIRGYAGELRQLFSNLILNSVEAMDDGGQMSLRVYRGCEFTGEMRPGVRVVIADNGVGISPANLQHIFEPFYTTKKDLGTGLGLWISQGIVQKHGGSIRLRSRTTPGCSGTAFSIFLPDTEENSKAA